jgi:hypothetical protein
MAYLIRQYTREEWQEDFEDGVKADLRQAAPLARAAPGAPPPQPPWFPTDEVLAAADEYVTRGTDFYDDEPDSCIYELRRAGAVLWTHTQKGWGHE